MTCSNEKELVELYINQDSSKPPEEVEGGAKTANSDTVLHQPRAPGDEISKTGTPANVSYSQALAWVNQVLKRTRGRSSLVTSIHSSSASSFGNSVQTGTA